MENPFLAGKIIYFYGAFSMAMFNNQRVNNIGMISEVCTW
jgi:hypothetical protein